MLCSADIPGRYAFFMKENRSVDHGERGGVCVVWGEVERNGGMEGGGTTVRMYWKKIHSNCINQSD